MTFSETWITKNLIDAILTVICITEYKCIWYSHILLHSSALILLSIQHLSSLYILISLKLFLVEIHNCSAVAYLL